MTLEEMRALIEDKARARLHKNAFDEAYATIFEAMKRVNPPIQYLAGRGGESRGSAKYLKKKPTNLTRLVRLGGPAKRRPNPELPSRPANTRPSTSWRSQQKEGRAGIRTQGKRSHNALSDSVPNCQNLLS